ncbi:SMEK domain-containing protein [Vibrio cyclitrophicus]
MASERRKFVHQISTRLAVLKIDLKQNQVLNDLSLNMASENFFRDVLRIVRDWDDLENLNFFEKCAKSIDLISVKSKTIIQVTSTKTAAKLDASLEALKDTKYKGYSLRILYLLELPNFSEKKKAYVLEEFGVNVDDIVYGTEQLIEEVDNLTQPKLERLAYDYFSDSAMRYTTNSVLQLTCHELVKGMGKAKIKRQTTNLQGVPQKITANKLNNNDEIMLALNSSIDFAPIILANVPPTVLVKLSDLIVHQVYRESLVTELTNYGCTLTDVVDLDTAALHKICVSVGLDMSPVLFAVYHVVREKMLVQDFNAFHIPWVIIFTFFEICDIGYIGGNQNDNA